MNFLGLEGKAAEYGPARAVVLQAPYERTCTFGSGASKGPEAVIRASVEAEWYDEVLDLPLDEVGIATLPPPPIENLEPEAMVKRVCETALPVVQAGKIPAGLGGEHTVTLGFLQAVLDRHPEVTVLQIDAHPDLRDEYQGRRICHATVGRRILDRCSLVQVGLRAFSLEEQRFLEGQTAASSPRVRPFSTRYIQRNPLWIDQVVDALSDPVYITLDVDGLDPSVIPHTGTPEPGGLDWQACCDLLHAVAAKKRIVGFDLVELSPEPGSRSSDFTVARLCMRLIGLCARPGFRISDPPF